MRVASMVVATAESKVEKRAATRDQWADKKAVMTVE